VLDLSLGIGITNQSIFKACMQKESVTPSFLLVKAISPLLLMVVSSIFISTDAYAQALKLQRQGDYTFITGGLNDEEQSYLEAQAPKYPIQLVFRNNGQITDVKDVALRVKNVAGDVMVETKIKGPFLYLNPPSSGRFTFEADLGSETISMTKDLIGRRYLHLVFDFNKPKVE
jgi:hypothetical protein